MNPVGYPSEHFPLQERDNGIPKQPGESTVAQYTTVNISTEHPKDHIIWSIFSFAYLNPFCLGLSALIFSIKARDRKVAGDLEGARRYGSTARWLNIWATVLLCIMAFIFIVLIAKHRSIGILGSNNVYARDHYYSG